MICFLVDVLPHTGWSTAPRSPSPRHCTGQYSVQPGYSVFLRLSKYSVRSRQSIVHVLGCLTVSAYAYTSDATPTMEGSKIIITVSQSDSVPYPHQNSFSYQRCSCPTWSPGTVMGRAAGPSCIPLLAIAALLQQAPTADGGKEGNSQWLLQHYTSKR